jgi:hypothetical protein
LELAADGVLELVVRVAAEVVYQKAVAESAIVALEAELIFLLA